MSTVNYYRTYQLNEIYEKVKAKSGEVLGNYLAYPDLYRFNDEERSLTFKSERLIPQIYSGRPRVMLLFSNPHPHSVHQGMLLSPNTRGKENAFWETMRAAGWINFKEETSDPIKIAEKCFKVQYEGPFDFVFYPYYSFPTNYPQEIEEIFGSDTCRRVIGPEAQIEFMNVVSLIAVDAVVVFNKEIFNIVAEEKVDKPIKQLVNETLIISKLKNIEKRIPIYLTFPTGWHYHKDIKRLRKISLDLIKTAILKSQE